MPVQSCPMSWQDEYLVHPPYHPTEEMGGQEGAGLWRSTNPDPGFPSMCSRRARLSWRHQVALLPKTVQWLPSLTDTYDLL